METLGPSIGVLINCGIAVFEIIAQFTYDLFYCSHSVIVAVLLCGLGNTGLFFAPNATTNMEYVSPSVRSVNVSSVLLVFPPLSVLLPAPVA